MLYFFFIHRFYYNCVWNYRRTTTPFIMFMKRCTSIVARSLQRFSDIKGFQVVVVFFVVCPHHTIIFTGQMVIILWSRKYGISFLVPVVRFVIFTSMPTTTTTQLFIFFYSDEDEKSDNENYKDNA